MPINEKNGFFYTEVKGTPEQEKFMREARNQPYMVVGGSVPPSFEECVHACAIRSGLPEIRGYYGYDFSAHEFIRLADADQGEPDTWPSRRLDDILKGLGQ
jgi:hypothetical protein